MILLEIILFFKLNQTIDFQVIVLSILRKVGGVCPGEIALDLLTANYRLVSLNKKISGTSRTETLPALLLLLLSTSDDNN